MSWHYQIRRKEIDDTVLYDIVEVYTDPYVWTVQGMRPCGDTPEEVIIELQRMLKDAKAYPVLEE